MERLEGPLAGRPGLLYDFELVDEIQKLAPAMAKQKYTKSNLIVEVDSCYSQGMFARYAAGGKLRQELPENVSIAWSAGIDDTCDAPGDDRTLKTPWTKGFEKAFEGNQENEKKQRAWRRLTSRRLRPAVMPAICPIRRHRP